MKTFKKLFCLFLALSMLMLTACKKDDKINTITVAPDGVVIDENGDKITINSESDFIISYSKSDSLNPFLSNSINNQQLAFLLYQPLFKLDENFKPKNIVADSHSFDELKLTVKIKADVKFSDGSFITSDDVVYSFNNAKNSPAYSANLANFTTVSTKGDSVTFTLANKNIYAVYDLTFPIVKNNSITDEKPWGIGAGKYLMKANGTDYLLEPNGKYELSPVFTTIKLVNIESRTSLDNALKIGNISFAYKDLSEGTMASINAKTKKVPLNNMVYVGFNGAGYLTKNPNLRKAVSYAINRSEIVSGAYHGFAKSALSVFNPSWAISESAVISSVNSDSKATKTSLDVSGYNSQPLKLIVNAENSFRCAAADLIAKQLSVQGISVTVDKLAYDMYVNYIVNGWFDMYIGEVRLTNDMSLSPFFTENGACRYGIDFANSKTIENYNQFVTGEGELGSFILNFQEEMPFVPVVYRSGVVAYTNQMKVKPTSHYGDIFENISEWTY